MLNYSPTDVLQTLENAKNCNAAIKKVLKNEVRNDPKSERFVKSLRSALLSKDEDSKLDFLQKHLPAFESHLLVITRYAYATEVATLAEEIFSRFAEEFNTTYSKNENSENGIDLTNAKRFKEITLEVLAVLKDGFNRLALPSSNFMLNVMFFYIFDKEVLDAVFPILETAS